MFGYSYADIQRQNRIYAGANEATTSLGSLSSAQDQISALEPGFTGQLSNIRSDYASALSDIDTQFSNISAELASAKSGILSEINLSKQLSDNAYKTIAADMNDMVTNLEHSQTLQVSQAASQLDAMSGSGQFGGNVYRSQQVYSMNMSNIITASQTAISEATLQYRIANESLQQQYNAQQMNSYIQGVLAITSASVDAAKTYAMIRADVTTSKNAALNQVLSVMSQYSTTVQGIQSSERVSMAQIEAQKLMAAVQNSATMAQIKANSEAARMQYSLNVSAQDIDQQRADIAAEANSIQNQSITLNYEMGMAQLQADQNAYDSPAIQNFLTQIADSF